MGAQLSADSTGNNMAEHFVNQQISGNNVVVFSKTYCDYSRMAKNALQKIGAQFTTVELDQRNDGGVLQKYLGELTGESTVPRVFVNGRCIGGGTRTKSLKHSGKLKKMIFEASSY